MPVICRCSLSGITAWLSGRASSCGMADHLEKARKSFAPSPKTTVEYAPLPPLRKPSGSAGLRQPTGIVFRLPVFIPTGSGQQPWWKKVWLIFPLKRAITERPTKLHEKIIWDRRPLAGGFGQNFLSDLLDFPGI